MASTRLLFCRELVDLGCRYPFDFSFNIRIQPEGTKKKSVKRLQDALLDSADEAKSAKRPKASLLKDIENPEIIREFLLASVKSQPFGYPHLDTLIPWHEIRHDFIKWLRFEYYLMKDRSYNPFPWIDCEILQKRVRE